MGRATLRFQRLSLFHAEPVLFIGNDKSQMGKDHIFLNQRMGTDEYIDRTILQALKDFISFRFFCFSRKIGHMDGKIFVEFLKRLIVLAGQDFRRRHKGSLIAVFHNLCQGQGRHGGLAAPHIPLDEALHGDKPFHIIFNVGKSLLLSVG